MVGTRFYRQGLVETGDGNWLFIPFGLLSCFIAIFHFFIKPAITSLIVLYVFFFVRSNDGKPANKKRGKNYDSILAAESSSAETGVYNNYVKEKPNQENQTTTKRRYRLPILGYLIIE